MTNNSRIGSAGATSPQVEPCGGAYVTIKISPVIEREFKRRDVFPELRLETAVRVQNGTTGVHKVSVERAEAVVADAVVMRTRGRELRRGAVAAYSALARTIQHSLAEEARRGLWPDPGFDVALQRADDSPARFDVGEVVLCFENEDVEYGTEAVIVRAYGMQGQLRDDGHYVDEDGRRFDYRRGYLIVRKGSGDTRYFAAPHQLTRDDCQPSYLSLVHSASSQPSAEVCQ